MGEYPPAGTIEPMILLSADYPNLRNAIRAARAPAMAPPWNLSGTTQPVAGVTPASFLSLARGETVRWPLCSTRLENGVPPIPAGPVHSLPLTLGAEVAAGQDRFSNGGEE